MQKFWNWVSNNDTETRMLFIEGEIASQSWWGDEITPKLFKAELDQGKGDIDVYINSPGGDCIAASQIYTMLMEYKGNVTVKIDGLVASAASVIAMAGTKVIMSPPAMMMIHNPLTLAIGDSQEMKKTIAVLDEFKESILNAYELKTSLSREELSDMMDAETWLNAKKALEYGFIDEILSDEKKANKNAKAYAFSRKAVTNSLFEKVNAKPTEPITKIESKNSIDNLQNRLNLLGGN